MKAASSRRSISRRDVLLPYFVQLPDNDKQFRCDREKCQGKLLSKQLSNLERHLRLVHEDVYESYMQVKNDILMKPPQNHDDDSSAVTMSSSPTSCFEVPIIKEEEHSENEGNTIRIDCSDIIEEESILEEDHKFNNHLAIVEMFIRNEKPIAMLKRSNFRILLGDSFKDLRISPTKKGVEKLILNFGQDIKKEILESIKNKLVSLKFDAMTRNGKSVLAVNVQYIKGVELQTRTLVVKEVNTEYGDKFFKLLVSNVIFEYGLDRNKILTYTYDAGETLLQDPETQDKSMNRDTCNNFAVMRMIQQKMASLPSNLDAKEFKCAAALFETCINEACAVETIQERIEQCRLIVKELVVLNRPELNDFKEGRYKPILDNSFNWLSTYDMLKRLLEILAILDSEVWQASNLTISDELSAFMEEFLKIFEPFYTVTVKLQNENPVFSEYYIFLMDLIIRLENVATTETAIKDNLLRTLKEKKDELFENDLFKAAVYLDPRIRICLKSEQQEEAKEFLKTLNDRVERINGDRENLSHSIEETQSTTACENQEPSVPKSFVEYLDTLDSKATINRTVKIKKITIFESDLITYEKLPRFPIDANVLQFWSNQTNRLSEIAKMILAIPFTQSSLERVISALNFFEKEAQDFDGYNLESVLFARLNGNFQYRN